MKKSVFFCIVLSLCLVAMTAQSPDQALASARAAATPAESVKILEAGLAASGTLRPWYVLELARYSALQGNWRKVLDWSTIQIPSRVPAEIAPTVAWYHAEALIRNGQSDRAAVLLAAYLSGESPADAPLFLQFFRSAVHPSSTLASASGVEPMLRVFDAKFPELASSDPLSWVRSRYLAGLAAVKTGSWEQASDYFSAFIAGKGETHDPALASWNRYYLAYSFYRRSSWTDAVREFSVFLERWSEHPNLWAAASSAALAAIQGGIDPLPFAERAIRLAPGRAEQAESMLLKASILVDKRRFEQAEAVLSGVAEGSTTNGVTPSSPRALYQLAELYLRLGIPAEAENWWLILLNRYPDHPLADEALFRCGEILYIASEWKRATDFFSRYRRTMPRGRFTDQVLWSGGDAYRRALSNDLAILWWEELIQKYPQSAVVPRTMEELTAVYRKKGDYQNALRVARLFKEAHPEAAVTAEIDREIDELSRLADGESIDSAALLAAYNREGKAATASGRSAGVQLARAYLEDYTRRDAALAVLREITARMPARTNLLTDGEKYTWATAWTILGNMYREDRNYADASAALLSAGTLFAPLDGERAAEALYGAADSFLQTGKRADAVSTVATLQRSWPDSVWTKRAQLLVE